MSETLPFAQFVAQQLQRGKYQSYDDMVQAGLRLLQAHFERLCGCLAISPSTLRFVFGLIISHTQRLEGLKAKVDNRDD